MRKYSKKAFFFNYKNDNFKNNVIEIEFKKFINVPMNSGEWYFIKLNNECLIGDLIPSSVWMEPCTRQN